MQERFGPRSAYSYEREDQLWEWSCATNLGVMGIAHDVIPECLDFCLEQYQRFKVPVTAEIYNVLEVGMSSAFYYVDCIDPYALFYGISDVNMTDDWCEHAYEVRDSRYYYEVDPEHIETFVHAPRQGEEAFNNFMSHPGLEAAGAIGHGIVDVMNGEWGVGEDRYTRTNLTALEALKDLCRVNGKVDMVRMAAYYDLAAWASLTWIAGPLSAVFRAERHDVFAVTLRYGEAILVDGCVISPEDYRRANRPPESCSRCGVSAWCVELIAEMGGTRYICEHCSSQGMPAMGFATCGTKRCMLSQCPHHPYHGYGPNGHAMAYRNHGQLMHMAKGESVTRIGGEQKRGLLQG